MLLSEMTPVIVLVCRQNNATAYESIPEAVGRKGKDLTTFPTLIKTYYIKLKIKYQRIQ